MRIGNIEINVRKKKPVAQPEQRGLDFGLAFNSMSSYSSKRAMQLSAVYAAVNQISNSCALLPIQVMKTKGGRKEIVDHTITPILNTKVNENMNHFQFIKLMIESVMLRGEAFAYIQRNESLEVEALYYVPADNVQVIVTGQKIKYLINGMKKAVDNSEMIHLWLHLDENTHRGISIISYASKTLGAANDAVSHSSNFFRSGANLSGIIKASANLTNEQKQQIRDSWGTAFNNNTNDVSVAILPQGLDYQPISVSPEDAQLLESRQYDVIEIARFFNISPVKLFDLTNSSYATLEQTQLSYVQDTIYPYVRMMEEELYRKLFTPKEQNKFEIAFDFSELLETDKSSQASYYKTLLVNGIMSLNEVRERLDLPKVEDGDVRFLQLNMTTTQNIVDGKNLSSAKIDNKFKLDDGEEDEEGLTEKEPINEEEDNNKTEK